MELEIQKYLRSEKSLQDLIWDYDLQTFESENYPELICFDYSILSPKNDQITKEARGLVLRKNSWDVCCVSMSRFHYQNDELKYKNSKAFVKYDGCLVILYYHDKQWLTATRFSVDGNCYVASAYAKEKNIKWNELFNQTLQSMKIEPVKFYSSLNEDFCYSFELCTKFNKNITIYDEDFLKLIAVTNKTNFKEINILSENLLYQFPDLEPEFFEIQTFEEVEDMLSKDVPGYELEGYVITDSMLNRRKIRNPNFNALSNIDDNKNLEYIQNLIKAISPVDDEGPV
jgi:hypothetical protein